MTSVDHVAITASIDSAWAAVEASQVPDHVRTAAFIEVLRSTLSMASSAGAGRAEREKPSRESAPDGPMTASKEVGAIDVDEAEVLRLVYEETGVPVKRLEEVVMLDGGVVKLIGAHSKYGSNAAEQARTVAQIVTVVRKIGMGESDTAFEIIKAACESKHCYDSKNFANVHLPKIVGFAIKGEKKNRRLEARGGGIAAFPALIDRILAA